jgi:hypothetical protein
MRSENGAGFFGLAQTTIGKSGRDTHTILTNRLGFKPNLMEYIEAKYRFYFEMAAQLRMRPGAVAIDGLKELVFPFAVVSNSDRIFVDANLKAVGLQFPDLVTVSRNDFGGSPVPSSTCVRISSRCTPPIVLWLKTARRGLRRIRPNEEVLQVDAHAQAPGGVWH